jgi:hypothetical protein
MTDEELKNLVASLAVKSASLDEQQRLTNEQMKRTDEQLKRTDAKLEKIGMMLGNIGRNQGDVAEEFFFNSLVDDIHLGEIHFDDISHIELKHRGKIQEGYDLLLTNDNAVGIIEIKYKAHENDLSKLERKLHNFKKLYPRYSDCKVYGALAAFHIHDDLKQTALERGFFVLQRRGNIVHTDCAQQLMVL